MFGLSPKSRKDASCTHATRLCLHINSRFLPARAFFENNVEALDFGVALIVAFASTINRLRMRAREPSEAAEHDRSPGDGDSADSASPALCSRGGEQNYKLKLFRRSPLCLCVAFALGAYKNVTSAASAVLAIMHSCSNNIA